MTLSCFYLYYRPCLRAPRIQKLFVYLFCRVPSIIKISLFKPGAVRTCSPPPPPICLSVCLCLSVSVSLSPSISSSLSPFNFLLSHHLCHLERHCSYVAGPASLLLTTSLLSSHIATYDHIPTSNHIPASDHLPPTTSILLTTYFRPHLYF